MKVHILDGVFKPHQLRHWQKGIEQGHSWFERLD